MSHYKTLFWITYSFAKLTDLPAIAFAMCLPQAGWVFCLGFFLCVCGSGASEEKKKNHYFWILETFYHKQMFLFLKNK